MSSDWCVAALGDLLDDLIDHRGRTPKKLGGDFTPSGVRVISAKNVRDGRLDLSFEPRFVSEEMYRRWMPSELRTGDVLLTSEAPMGQAAYLNGQARYCLGQRLFALRAKSGVLDGRFLFYYFRSSAGQAGLHARVSGTTAQGIRQSELVRVSVPLPPFAEQQRIAGVLGALDDKIDHNRQLQDRLFRLCQSEFQAAFASTEFDTPLGEVAEVIDCLHSKKPERQQAGRPLLQVWNIRDDGLLDMSDAFLIRSADYEAWSRRIEVRDGDCIITNVGRIGAVAQLIGATRAALGRNMTAVRVRSHFPYPSFVTTSLLSPQVRRDIEALTDAGTVMGALNVRSIPSLRLPAADRARVAAFETKSRPSWQLRGQLLEEGLRLAAIRDALLPKLVSGRIQVPEGYDADDVLGTIVERAAAS